MKTLPKNFEFPSGVPMKISRNDQRVYNTKKEKEIRVFYLEYLDHPLFFRALFRGRVERTYHYIHEHCSFLSVEMVRNGSLYASNGKEKVLLESGDIAIFPPGSRCEIMTGPDKYCEKDSVSVYGKLLGPYLQNSPLSGKMVIEGFDMAKIDGILQSIEKLDSFPATPEKNFRNSMLAYEFLELLSSCNVNNKIDPLMIRLLHYMQAHLDQKLSTEDFCSFCGMTKAKLAQSFRDSFGMTLHKKFMELRMERAAHLLLNSPDLSIKEIADRVGFQNQMNFATAFRNHFHAAPGEYRRTRADFMSNIFREN